MAVYVFHRGTGTLIDLDDSVGLFVVDDDKVDEWWKMYDEYDEDGMKRLTRRIIQGDEVARLYEGD